MGKRRLEMCYGNLYLFMGWKNKLRKGNVNNNVVGSWWLTQVLNHAEKILSCSKHCNYCCYVVVVADYDNLQV
ncbi:unnamed protein product [Malus baccata var. baccata]